MNKKYLSYLKTTAVVLIATMLMIPPLIGLHRTPFKAKQTDGSLVYTNDIEDSLDSIIHELTPSESVLDYQFIYNITKALSHIIFTEYNESNGEIAKGRFFGTKGEWRAAEILYENMTKLGLNTTMEKLENLPEMAKIRLNPKLAEITHKLEVLDYDVKVNGREVDSYISPPWFAPRGRRDRLNCNLSYTDLKVRERPRFPSLPDLKIAKGEDFVFIDIDKWFNPDYPTIRMPLLNPLNRKFFPYISLTVQTRVWRLLYPNCKGLILYDFNNDTHDMVLLKTHVLPILFINNTIGKEVIENMEEATVDFYINQSYNKSVVSYNVIGQLNGTDSNKTVIVGCLYDSWWCQGTGDAAIGMAMVLGVAKYFVDHNITPKYNMKFIGFSGEEYGFAAGSQYYEAAHLDENITYVIDLNQLGFWQDYPKLTLNIVCNKIPFLKEIWKVVKRTDYEKRIGYTAGIKPLWMKSGAPSNDYPFAKNRRFCKTVSFLKDTGWKLHHRDGLNHTEGDVMKYFYPDDVNVTGEIIWNVTQHLTVDLPG